MLTGKAKELFEDWYYNEVEELWIRYDKDSIQFLEDIDISMQWGVYQDFADSLGWRMMVEHNNGNAKFESYIHNDKYMSKSKSYFLGFYKTRNEARIKAIEKLNEILNNG